MPDDRDKTLTIPEERPTQPELTRTCPECQGLGRIVEPAGPGRYRPTECPECKGLKVVTVERYKEIVG